MNSLTSDEFCIKGMNSELKMNNTLKLTNVGGSAPASASKVPNLSFLNAEFISFKRRFLI